MKLYIDTSNSKKVVVVIDEKRFERESKKGSSQTLLSLIDEVLNSEGKRLEDISKIEVETGPGSFTGLRVGVSVANALGWTLKVPVNGKKVGSGESVDITYSPG